MKTVHVEVSAIKHNSNHPDDLKPCFIVCENNVNTLAHSVRVNGPGTFKHSPHNQPSRAWFETDADLELG